MTVETDSCILHDSILNLPNYMFTNIVSTNFPRLYYVFPDIVFSGWPELKGISQYRLQERDGYLENMDIHVTMVWTTKFDTATWPFLIF